MPTYRLKNDKKDMSINPYTKEEMDRIQKVADNNDKMEEFFKGNREAWSKKVEPLFQSLTIDMNNPESAKRVFESQTLALTYRQEISDSISYFLTKRGKEQTKLNRVRQDKIIYYATGFPVKMGSTQQQSHLIEAHLSENERSVKMIETYIEFMRDTAKNLESLSFAIKNKIELMNYLGRL